MTRAEQPPSLLIPVYMRRSWVWLCIILSALWIGLVTLGFAVEGSLVFLGQIFIWTAVISYMVWALLRPTWVYDRGANSLTEVGVFGLRSVTIPEARKGGGELVAQGGRIMLIREGRRDRPVLNQVFTADDGYLAVFDEIKRRPSNPLASERRERPYFVRSWHRVAAFPLVVLPLVAGVVTSSVGVYRESASPTGSEIGAELCSTERWEATLRRSERIALGTVVDESQAPAIRDQFRCEITATFTPAVLGAEPSAELEVEIFSYRDPDVELPEGAYTCDQIEMWRVSSEARPVDTTDRPVCIEVDDGHSRATVSGWFIREGWLVEVRAVLEDDFGDLDRPTRIALLDEFESVTMDRFVTPAQLYDYSP